MRILTSGANGDKQVYSYGRVKTEDANGNVLTRVDKETFTAQQGANLALLRTGISFREKSR